MRAFLAWLHGAALGLGGPGLFAAAFLDSSFLSLPQVNDILVVMQKEVTFAKALETAIRIERDQRREAERLRRLQEQEELILLQGIIPKK